MRALPVIDAAALRAARRPHDAEVRRLHDACSAVGFFYLGGHGIAAARCDGVLDAARAFFALPAEEKLALDLDASPARHGYEPLLRQTLDGAARDVKEGFYVGREAFGPNQWPARLPALRATLEGFHRELTQLAGDVMRGLALSLELPADAFAAFCREPVARLRLLHYPPQPPDAEPGVKGAGAHTDYGGITLLLQDDVGGLLVRDRDADAWIAAPPLPGTFVVNLGDMLARWTNDRYRSTLHCVVNASGRERFSVPFFFHGNPETLIACLPTCLGPGETPRYAPVTAAAHFRERMNRSYAAPTGTAT